MLNNEKEFELLTKQLEQKEREYHLLCERLENLKKLEKFNKTEQLENLKVDFVKNLEDIREIKQKLKMLSED